MFRGTQTEDDRGPLSIQSSLGLMHAIFIVRNPEHDLNLKIKEFHRSLCWISP
jgi:hypothetical protein